MDEDSDEGRVGRDVSYGKLIERVAAARWPNNKGSARPFKSQIARWCASIGISLVDPAYDTLCDGFSARMAKFERANADALAPQTLKNIKTAVERLRLELQAVLADASLPSDFCEALQIAARRKDWGAKEMIRALYEQFFKAENPEWYGAQLYEWMNSRGAPGRSWRGDSRLLVERLEKVLDLPPGVLTSRAYPARELVIQGTAQEIRWREHQTKLTASPFALPTLPAAIQRIWPSYVAHRRKKLHSVDGKTYPLKTREHWSSDATEQIHQEQIKRYCGWLCLPCTAEGPNAQFLTGKGMMSDDITLKHLLDVDLLAEYCEFLRSRQANKVVTKTVVGFLVSMNCLVSKPYAFLRRRRELAPIFDQAPDITQANWDLFIEERVHKPLVDLLKALDELVVMHERSPDSPLTNVFTSADPFGYFQILVSRMEAELPPPARQQQRACAVRDIALFRMQMEVPLRNKNMSELSLDRSLTQDGDGSWRVFVPKSALKNHHSEHAEDINRVYSTATSLAISRYLEEGGARDRLYGAGSCRTVFLRHQGGAKRDANEGVAAFAFKPDGISDIVRRYAQRYFGVEIGNTVFRHLNATSILKDDVSKVRTAAAVLNNSPRMIETNYGHVTQQDDLRHADAWRAEKEKRFQASNSQRRR